MNIMHNYFCRRETNCDDEEDTTVSVSAGDDGVEAVEDISTESVTTPPDNLVAEEIQHNEEFALFQKKQNTGKPQPSTSTSTTSISSKVHLQDISKNSRLNPAAKQRMAMQSAMLSMFEKSQLKMSEDPEDDLDLSFASIAMRMRRNFDLLQREQIYVEIMNIMNEAIRNKAQGTPLIVPKIGIAEHMEKMQQLQIQLQQQNQQQQTAPVPPPPPMQHASGQLHQAGTPMQQGQLIAYEQQGDGSFLTLLQSKSSA